MRCFMNGRQPGPVGIVQELRSKYRLLMMRPATTKDEKSHGCVCQPESSQ